MVVSRFPSLDRLEVPPCDCDMPGVKACVFFFPQGCPEKQRQGYCEHPYFVKLCDHLFKAEDPFFDTAWAIPYLDEEDDEGLLREWVGRLIASSPKDYLRPRKRPLARPDAAAPVYEKPMDMPTRSARAAILAIRQRLGLYLWHPGDVHRDRLNESEVVRVAAVVDNFKNGTLRGDSDISTFGQDEEEEPTVFEREFSAWEQRWRTHVLERTTNLLRNIA